MLIFVGKIKRTYPHRRFTAPTHFEWQEKQKPDVKGQALKILFLTLWFFFEANVLSVKTFRPLLNFERYFLTRF